MAAQGSRRMTAPLVGYQYVVLRCVPRVDRDELMNVGVVLHSLSVAFLDRAFAVDNSAAELQRLVTRLVR